MTKQQFKAESKRLLDLMINSIYTNKDIFLRELISNGCDAISKHKVLAAKGEQEARDNYRVDVVANEEAGMLTITDNGIGMTAEEIEKYICQVAFSGAEEFLKMYKPEDGDKSGIIGHFGLGFYSAFMVSQKVEIDTLSCAPARASFFI